MIIPPKKLEELDRKDAQPYVPDVYAYREIVRTTLLFLLSTKTSLSYTTLNCIYRLIPLLNTNPFLLARIMRIRVPTLKMLLNSHV